MPVCWTAPQSSIAISLLVCRLERGIRVQQTTRALLERIKPKLIRVAQHMRKQGVHEPISDLVLQLYSVVYEALKTSYRMGDHVHPLRWLFRYPQGAVYRWALAQIQAHRKQDRLRKRMKQHVEPSEDDLNDVVWIKRMQDVQFLLQKTTELSLLEYRVVYFCLTHANPHSRSPIDGLQLVLARNLNTNPKNIQAIYGAAMRRLIDRVGLSHIYFATKKLRRTPQALQRMKRRANARVIPLTAEERKLVHTLRTTMTVLDIAWFFSVTPDCIYRVMRRSRGTE